MRFHHTSGMGRIAGTVLLTGWILTAGCGDDDTTKPGNLSRVRGRVAGGAGTGAAEVNGPSAIDGATVTLHRIGAGGTLEVISTESVTTDAQGRFTIETSESNERNPVIKATANTTELMAVVSAEIRTGVTVASPPLTEETTAEARTLVEITDRGTAGVVPFADASEYINADLAAKITAGTITTAETAEALETEAGTHIMILTDAPFSLNATSLTALSVRKAEARATLDAALESAGNSQAAIDQAYDDFTSAMIAAYTETGLDPAAYARVREASARAFVKAIAGFESTARLAGYRSSALVRARLVTRAVEAQWVVLGASTPEKQQIANAGAALLSSIRVASTISGIETSFIAYHDAAIDALADVMDAHAAGVVAADAAINVLGGPRDGLLDDVAAAATMTAVVDAYEEFYIEAANVTELMLAGTSPAELEAGRQVLILTNMSAGT